jgi:non-canonical (house-cleaning) NTP pyrophosphatase
MESGLFRVETKLFDVCACAIFDGEHHHLGYSCAWELPEAVVRKVEDEGKNLTEAFNECGICNDPNIGDKGGVLGIMTGDRITRPDYTVQSVQMALLALNPAHYACSSAVPTGINDAPK